MQLWDPLQKQRGISLEADWLGASALLKTWQQGSPRVLGRQLCNRVPLPHQADQDVKPLHEQPHHPRRDAVLRIHLPLRPRWILRLRKDL